MYHLLLGIITTAWAGWLSGPDKAEMGTEHRCRTGNGMGLSDRNYTRQFLTTSAIMGSQCKANKTADIAPPKRARSMTKTARRGSV